jgi:hypothetical protein
MAEKVMIYTTADEIAAGMEKWMEKHSSRNPEPDFTTEKMTVGQGAHFIDVSYPTLCNWINEGKVPVHGKGRTRFLLKSELIEAYKNLNK